MAPAVVNPIAGTMADPLIVQAEAHRGALKLCQLVDAKGRFRYRYDAISDADARGYNVLRHCGAIWAMMDVHGATGEAALLAACERATVHLLNRYLRYYGDYRLACICEQNKVKLGGNALAVLALLAVYQVTREPALRELAVCLGRFLLHEQRADGDFHHKRYYRSGRISRFRSMYYTGEALLALLRLHEVTREPAWKEAALHSEALLAPAGYGVAEQSHWMLYALERLHDPARGNSSFAHAAAIVGNILDVPAYREWGRSTPVACRTEGLLAFVRMLGRDPAVAAANSSLVEEVWRAVEENLRLQRQFRLPDGAFIRGGRDQRRTEVRIDYIQHNISAFLDYARLAGSAPGGSGVRAS